MSYTDKSIILTSEAVIQIYLETKTTLSKNINPELEVRFGTRNIGKISKNNFDNTIKFLLSKKFTFTPTNKYYLNIKVDDIRVEIDNIINIQDYCKTNQLPSDYQQSRYTFTKKNLYMIEDKTPARANLDAFNFRITYSTEENIESNSSDITTLISNWTSIKKFNRLIDRYTLIHDDIPIKVDFSIVRESTSNTISESNLFKILPKFEIELEILNDKVGEYSKDELNKIIKKVSKYILSGLQNTNFPISYPEITSIGKNYLELINARHDDIKPTDFIGPSSVTLQISNIGESNSNSNIVNIKKNFTVTDKADGDRKLLYINDNGKIYLINTQSNIEFTGAKTENKELFDSLLDGEHIIHNKLGNYINLYAAFDIYFINKKDIRNLEFISINKSELPTNYRWNLLDNLLKLLNPELIHTNLPSPISIQMKRFYDITDGQSLFAACSLINEQIKANQYEYNTDGFIFTPKNFGVGMTETDKKTKNYKHTWDYSFKWKPAEYNTIDFLVTTKKTKSGVDFIGNKFENGLDTTSLEQIIQYKTVILRVGYDVNKHGFANPCQYLIDDIIPFETDFDSEERFKPVQFVPSNPYDSDAGIANLDLRLDNMSEKQMFTEENEVIEDNTIVECRYDVNRPKGWRWIPLRVRYDKTAEYRAGYKSYGNAYHVAQNNWFSIHNPITIEMITTGENISNENSQDDIYYNKVKGSNKTKALRDFHNLFVKSKLINNISHPGDTLIDYAVGKGGDIPKWISAKLSFILGIDYSRDNIRNPVDGVCARYLKYKQKFKDVPNALFVYGNSSKNIKDGSAIVSDVGKEITNAIFGFGIKDQLGKGILKSYGIASEGFNISSIQFAIHYMFENNQTLHNFLTNIAECTKIDGYFIGTCFNGKKIFNLLNTLKINETYTFFDR